MEKQERDKKTNKDLKVKNIEFIGEVLEVHSGDSLTIQSLKTKNVARFFLVNVRAPQLGTQERPHKPWAYESKEFLRKKLIGQKVDVIFEYEKMVKIQKAWEEEHEAQNKQMNFATVFLQDTNINKLILQEGYALLNPARTDDEKSQFYQEYTQAEEEAKKKLKQIHSSKQAPIHLFNDYSRVKNKQKLNEAYTFLNSTPKLTGVVELIISGSLFKVRINEQACHILLLLSGIRCVPPDSNIAEYTTWANAALNFSKKNLLQRDVEIKLEKIDSKGKFHAQIFLNKTSFANSMLQEGLCFSFGKSKQQQEYEDLEKIAKEQKKGIFSSQKLNIDILRNQNAGEYSDYQIQNISGKITTKVTEIISTDEFYVHDVQRIKDLDKIENELDDFDFDAFPKLKDPVSSGTPFVGVFSGDEKFYRGKVIRRLQGSKYEVFFIDYGFYDKINVEDMCKMPEKWINIPPFAVKLGLAYCQGLPDKHSLAVESDESFKDLVWEQKMDFQYVYQDNNGTKFAVVTKQGVNDINQSVNFKLIQKGLIRLNENVNLPEQYQKWKDEEEFVSEKKVGLWAFDTQFGQEDD